MPIVVNLDVMLAKRKMSLGQLSQEVGVTMANLSILEAICKVLDCQPGDILAYVPEEET